MATTRDPFLEIRLGDWHCTYCSYIVPWISLISNHAPPAADKKSYSIGLTLPDTIDAVRAKARGKRLPRLFSAIAEAYAGETLKQQTVEAAVRRLCGKAVVPASLGINRAGTIYLELTSSQREWRQTHLRPPTAPVRTMDNETLCLALQCLLKMEDRDVMPLVAAAIERNAGIQMTPETSSPWMELDNNVHLLGLWTQFRKNVAAHIDTIAPHDRCELPGLAINGKPCPPEFTQRQLGGVIIKHIQTLPK